jgi:hypothetical protein
MFGRRRVLLTIAACVLAMPIAAQSPAPATTTAFDGTYLGVSVTVEHTLGATGATRFCGRGPPGTLKIVNGIAWRDDRAAGSVSAQGVLAMRTARGSRIDGQIDGHGTITARLTSYCSWRLIWQKQSP